ncbi:response regulator transcription factor [Anabaena sp. UHCC 0187]|uniref:response regulator transcription factor n=1 Tax=Anabaena sp. UHCC 0187 TaxID=2590018 RepID=UPI001447FA42|nr:DNA-binding response regulator [Anabaena sp. UHCC 0187]MDP5017978.1 DNA-binding response regulator [Dolichospermum sp.]MTJ15100.1 response regulator transcription factor [Anabaena sp. UHCC 0187]
MSEISIVLIEDHDLTRMELKTELQLHSGFKVIGEAVQVTFGGNSWIDPAIANVVLRKMRQGVPGEHQSADKPKTVKIEALDTEYEQVLETYPLTQRELEILELIVDGCSNSQIAEKLYITVGTVKTHVRNILNKLCSHDSDSRL